MISLSVHCCTFAAHSRPELGMCVWRYVISTVCRLCLSHCKHVSKRSAVCTCRCGQGTRLMLNLTHTSSSLSVMGRDAQLNSSAAPEIDRNCANMCVDELKRSERASVPLLDDIWVSDKIKQWTYSRTIPHKSRKAGREASHIWICGSSVCGTHIWIDMPLSRLIWFVYTYE